MVNTLLSALRDQRPKSKLGFYVQLNWGPHCENKYNDTIVSSSTIIETAFSATFPLNVPTASTKLHVHSANTTDSSANQLVKIQRCKYCGLRVNFPPGFKLTMSNNFKMIQPFPDNFCCRKLATGVTCH